MYCLTWGPWWTDRKAGKNHWSQWWWWYSSLLLDISSLLLDISSLLPDMSPRCERLQGCESKEPLKGRGCEVARLNLGEGKAWPWTLTGSKGDLTVMWKVWRSPWPGQAPANTFITSTGTVLVSEILLNVRSLSVFNLVNVSYFPISLFWNVFINKTGTEKKSKYIWINSGVT